MDKVPWEARMLFLEWDSLVLRVCEENGVLNHSVMKTRYENRDQSRTFHELPNSDFVSQSTCFSRMYSSQLYHESIASLNILLDALGSPFEDPVVGSCLL